MSTGAKKMIFNIVLLSLVLAFGVIMIITKGNTDFLKKQKPVPKINITAKK